jgi:hypothetical protein
MKYLNLLYLAVGVALLIIIFNETNFSEVWSLVSKLGWQGIVGILIVYAIGFSTDVATWLFCFINIPIKYSWFYRLFCVRIVGEAFNRITPFVSLGGEPLKAKILQNYYRISYQDSTISLILSTTIDTLGLIIFLTIGFVLLLNNNVLSIEFKGLAGLGLITLSFGIIVFFLIQRSQIVSKITNWLEQFSWSKQFQDLLELVKETDSRLAGFYSDQKYRFRGSFACAFLNWPLGVVEIYLTMHLLGENITIKDAWIVEAMAQLARNATFFIPASIGTQEGAFLLVCDGITGSSSFGIAVSIVRRFRELIWILLGLIVWIGYFWKSKSRSIK